MKSLSENSINQDVTYILEHYKNIAVVGISDKPYRDSHSVAKFMLDRGYRIFPVNPKLKEVLGLKCYASLSEIPAPVELVNIFRRSEFVEPIVEAAVEIGAKAVWMQFGVINNTAAERALQAGLRVVMDRCWKVDYRNYISG